MAARVFIPYDTMDSITWSRVISHAWLCATAEGLQGQVHLLLGSKALTMPSVDAVVMDVAWMHGAPFGQRASVDERLAYLKPMFDANLERLLQ
jgi:hypothetical protein